MGSKSGGAPQVAETPQERELAQIAAERWQEYQKVSVPVENAYMGIISNIGAGEKAGQAGAAAAAIQGQTGQMLQSARSNLAARGVNPASGAALATEQGIRVNTGRALGLGTSAANEGVEAAKLQGLESIVDIGSGQSDTAQTNLSDIAVNAAHNAISNAFQQQMTQAQTQAGIGEIVGAGAGAYANYSGWGMQSPSTSATLPPGQIYPTMTPVDTTYLTPVGPPG